MSNTPPTSGQSDDAASSHPDSATDGATGAGSTASGATPSGSGAPQATKKSRSGFLRRHWIVASLALVLVLVAGSAGGYWYWFDHRLSTVERIEIPTIRDRVPEPGVKEEEKRALNILLLGADASSEEQSVAQDLKDGEWTPFIHRSDTLIVAHVPADRKSVQLVSIPRDTWVPIKGYPTGDGHGKINAAFAYGGPDLAVQTVEQLTGMSIDHLAIIDWAGFKDLTTALDGIRVYIPETFYDESQRITWEKGWHEFEGQEALAYVRTRHGLANGDFDRIARQQNFIRATMSKLLSKSHDILPMTKVVDVTTKYLTIDSNWDNSELIDLGLSLRNLDEKDVQFLTAPLGRYDTSVDGQSIVRLDPKRSELLFSSVDNDNIERYLDKYPGAKLDGSKSVS